MTAAALASQLLQLAIALALAPPTVSANNQFRRPTTKGRIAFSQGLLSIGQVPFST